MSFTSDVKSEISVNELKPCCAKAQLCALVKLCSSLNFASTGMYLTITTENSATAKRILKLMKELYSVKSELAVMRKMNLRKNNIYVLRIHEQATHILNDLQILDSHGLHDHPSAKLLSKECCARAFLAGAFLACGSVNAPTKANYHLELAMNDEGLAKFVQKQMDKFNLPGKLIKRRNQVVVYLKASDKISDFLACIGAHQSKLEFEDSRIQRDFMNSLTRLDNCELANEMKSMAAGKSQCEDIEWIENYAGLDSLDAKLKPVAMIRKAHPDASLMELCEIYEEQTHETISKSGMRHRLNRIKEIAMNYKGE